MVGRKEYEDAVEEMTPILLEESMDGWTPRRPESRDPSTWTGVWRWVYADFVYRHAYDFLVAYPDGEAYCPTCEYKPEGDEWVPYACLDCMWDYGEREQLVWYLFKEGADE